MTLLYLSVWLDFVETCPLNRVVLSLQEQVKITYIVHQPPKKGWLLLGKPTVAQLATNTQTFTKPEESLSC
jgi:hypothetical protein